MLPALPTGMHRASGLAELVEQLEGAVLWPSMRYWLTDSRARRAP